MQATVRRSFNVFQVSTEERCLLESVHCGDLYRSDPKECSRAVADVFREALAHAAEGRTVLLLEDIGTNSSTTYLFLPLKRKMCHDFQTCCVPAGVTLQLQRRCPI